MSGAKKTAASLLMPSLTLALRSRARELSGPAAIVKDLNKSLKQLSIGAMFVTIYYARLHAASSTGVRMSEAQSAAAFAHEDGDSSWLGESGPIVRILPAPEDWDAVVPLERSDILTLFTDGVTEQEEHAGQAVFNEAVEEHGAEQGERPGECCRSGDWRRRLHLCGRDTTGGAIFTVVVVKMLSEVSSYEDKTKVYRPRHDFRIAGKMHAEEVRDRLPPLTRRCVEVGARARRA